MASIEDDGDVILEDSNESHLPSDIPSTSTNGVEIQGSETAEALFEDGVRNLPRLTIPPTTVLLCIIDRQKAVILKYEEDLNAIVAKQCNVKSAIRSKFEDFRTKQKVDRKNVLNELTALRSNFGRLLKLVKDAVQAHCKAITEQKLKQSRAMDKLLIKEAHLQKACDEKDQKITEQEEKIQLLKSQNQEAVVEAAKINGAEEVPARCEACIAHLAQIEQMRIERDEHREQIEELRSGKAQAVAQLDIAKDENEKMKLELKRANFQRDAWKANVIKLEDEIKQLKKTAKEEARRHALQLEEVSAVPIKLDSSIGASSPGETGDVHVSTTGTPSDSSSDKGGSLPVAQSPATSSTDCKVKSKEQSSEAPKEGVQRTAKQPKFKKQQRNQINTPSHYTPPAIRHQPPHVAPVPNGSSSCDPPPRKRPYGQSSYHPPSNDRFPPRPTSYNKFPGRREEWRAPREHMSDSWVKASPAQSASTRNAPLDRSQDSWSRSDSWREQPPSRELLEPSSGSESQYAYDYDYDRGGYRGTPTATGRPHVNTPSVATRGRGDVRWW
ncbi:hypothetical protein QR680_005771 [Steinernema hermaphroditum]|uniref:Uncharacterized protein n=1 Tax=Steinernema hermaphroditum TaxID=289476 RepID=A0AA39HTB9_9BILA|nr:hypothetical protein QR680_005771 [Steinernema hermaphroditum]